MRSRPSPGLPNSPTSGLRNSLSVYNPIAPWPRGAATKGTIVYDSVYGNTELVARMLAQVLEEEGHSAEVVRAKDALRRPVTGDILFLGSPTRLGTMTGRMRKVVSRLDPEAWGGRSVAAFDTGMQGIIDEDGASAAAKMHDIARSRGVRVHTPVLKVGVVSIRGPLSPRWEDMVRAYVREVLSSAAGREGQAGRHDTRSHGKPS
ncbi:MAG: flavodoxin domain-containing protein [Candidatus Thermoplasmatota archaeon]